MSKKTTKPIDKGISTESVPRIPIFSKGDFAFKGDSLIQVDDVLWSEELNCFRYAIFYTQGTKMEPCSEVFKVGGGGSFYWSEDEIKPITDPILLLRYALTKEYKSVECAEQNIRYSNRRIESLRIALETILPSSEATPTTPQT